MKLRDSLIAWEPKPGGKIQVGRLGKYDPPTHYFTTGGCWTWTQTCEDENIIKAFVLAEAMNMIVRDGLTPLSVHHALMDIDEYLDVCGADMPGVYERREKKHEKTMISRKEPRVL
jgi:hypothetical protein